MVSTFVIVSVAKHRQEGIAAVVIPVTFGLIWLHSPSIVFLAGSGMAVVSLLLARLVPFDPVDGNEVYTAGPLAIRSRA